jgi:outer membrane protein TolC
MSVVLGVMSRVLSIIVLLVLGLPGLSFADGKALSLTEYLDLVEAQSPDLSVEKAKVEAVQARASGIRLSPPMVGYMQMKDGSGTNRGYEISQEIPFPTKLSKDKEARNLESDSQKEMSKLQRMIVLADARVAYLDFWSAYSKLEIQREKLAWLKGHVKVTQSSSWSDTSAKAHLLEVESDRDLLENDVLSMESELVTARAALRSYAPDLNSNDIVPVEPPTLKIEIENSASNPALQVKEKELEALSAREDFQKQSYLPDFFLRLRSYSGNETSPQSQELMVGISLPFVFFWQPKAEVAESTAMRAKAEAELKKTKVDLETRVSSFTKKLEINQVQLKNLKESLIPRAEKRMKLVRNLSTRTMEGLDQHKSVMLGLLDLKIKAIDLRLEFEKNLRELLKLGAQNSGEGVTR